jgi:hypothetical protein
MKTKGLKFGILLLVLGLPLSLAGQQSLGDLARQLREQREKSAKKPVKVFTNDNLPQRPPGEGPSASAGMSTEAKPTPSSSAPSGTTEAAGAPAGAQGSEKTEASEDKKKTKEYWQDKFKTAREQLAKAQEVLQLSKDELNLLQIQDARAIDPSAKADFDAKVQAKQAEVDTNQAAVDKAKKQLDDLQKQFDDSGAPEDWSKTE